MAGTLAERIRERAKLEGGVEALRETLGLGGGTFYGLLRGMLPRTTRVIQLLERHGIMVRDLLS